MRIMLSGIVLSLTAIPIVSAKETPEVVESYEKFRADLSWGGNFHPETEEGIFVAAGHGLNVVVSRDDGKTWKRVFYGGPCGDHGHWAVWNSVAYTEGVFAIAAGWGAPGTIIRSSIATGVCMVIRNIKTRSCVIAGDGRRRPCEHY